MYVDGKPYTILGGEVHNSSASDADYMKEQVWPNLRGLNMNTLLVPVYWESVERREGEYDFSLPDALIGQAREEKLRLVFLWFGLWKNGISSYVPEWVKRDTERFFRAKDKDGKRMDVISPFCEAGVAADAKAFAELLKHLKETDGDQNTVIMVQVENEIGLLGSDRDYSEQAETVYRGEVPAELSEATHVNGTWEQAFGAEAPEVMMEYAYAKAVGRIAAAGKKEYPLPMCTNAWIEKFPWRPGGYPSGGPIARFEKLWKTFAPEIAMLCPDVYTTDFHAICREYTSEDNPLFIPEHRRDIRSMSHVFYGIGAYQMLGFSPFGVEDFLMLPEERKGVGNPRVMAALNIERSAWECEKSGAFLGKAYRLLDGSMTQIRQCRENGRLYGFLRKDEHERGTVIHLRSCDVCIRYMDKAPDEPKSAGLIMEGEDDELCIMGVNIQFSLLPKKDDDRTVGILRYSEGEFEEGRFCERRILNGDERYCMLMLDDPELQYLKWYFY